MGKINNRFWEEDIYWMLLEMQNSNIGTKEDLAKEYAHRINLWSTFGYGDICSFDEFYDCVKCGGFIDYDGHGIFIDNNTAEEIKGVRCNCEWLKKNKPENSDYIMWFNK